MCTKYCELQACTCSLVWGSLALEGAVPRYMGTANIPREGSNRCYEAERGGPRMLHKVALQANFPQIRGGPGGAPDLRGPPAVPANTPPDLVMREKNISRIVRFFPACPFWGG